MDSRLHAVPDTSRGFDALRQPSSHDLADGGAAALQGPRVNIADSGISLGRVTTLLLFGRAAGFVLALGNSIILARALGVERLGEYAYAMGIAALFSLIPNLGITTVLARSIARAPRSGAGILRATWMAQGLLAAGVVLIILTFALLLPVQPVPLSYVALAAIQLAVGSLSWPYLAVLEGRARYDRLAAAELTAGVTATVALIAAAVLQGSVVSFLFAQVLAAGGAVLVARWIAGSLLPRGIAESVNIGDLFRQAAPFGATNVVQSFYRRLDVLLLGQITSASQLGLYNVAYKPVTMAVYFGGTIAGVLFPVMAQVSRAGVPASFDRAIRGLWVSAPAMALVFCGLATPLLSTLYGREFTAAAPILMLLAWSAAANWLYAPLSVGLQARGYERAWLLCIVTGLVLNTAGNFWAIPRWGGLGAAGAILLSEIAVGILGVVFARRSLGFTLPAQTVLGGVVATSAAAMVLWVLQPVGPMQATVAALVMYGAFLLLFRVVTTADAVMVIGWIRQAASGASKW